LATKTIIRRATLLAALVFIQMRDGLSVRPRWVSCPTGLEPRESKKSLNNDASFLRAPFLV